MFQVLVLQFRRSTEGVLGVVGDASTMNELNCSDDGDQVVRGQRGRLSISSYTDQISICV